MGAGGSIEESRPRRPWWRIAAGLLAFLLLAGLVVLWIKAPALYGTGDAATTATATTRAGILAVAAALIAATAAGAGLYFTARTVRETQRANREADERGRQTLLETGRANRETDRRDRYAKAIEQLGHDKAPVRLGAMYSLERLAQDNLELRQIVVDVLCAYLRMPFKPPARYEPITETQAESTEDTSPADATDKEPERNKTTREELLVRQTAQRILADHLHRPPDTSGVDAQTIAASPEVTFWPKISLDLTEASLVDLDLRGISVTRALFEGATFSGSATFDGATFSGDAWFNRARFFGDAWFDETTFSGSARFDGGRFSRLARFNQAKFSGDVWFEGATFPGNAWFNRARFSGDAWFRHVHFSEHVGFEGATFSGNAWFVGVTFSGYAGFDGVTFSRNSVFNDAIFCGNAWFGGAIFSRDPELPRVQVLNIDDPNLNERRNWPTGWTVCPDADDPTRGTLVRRGSDP